MSMYRWFFFAVVAFVLAFGCWAGCDCGGDDDDNDSAGPDDDSGNGDWGPGDCETACVNAFDCAAGLWYEDMEECVDLCKEWLSIAWDCADCMLGCWVEDESCIEAGACMAECALGPCIDYFEDL